MDMRMMDIVKPPFVPFFEVWMVMLTIDIPYVMKAP